MSINMACALGSGCSEFSAKLMKVLSIFLIFNNLLLSFLFIIIVSYLLSCFIISFTELIHKKHPSKPADEPLV